MTVYARADFYVGSFVREIWFTIGQIRFYWIDEYHAATMTPIYKTRHLHIGSWSWSGLR